jgi:CheY-like chemotaxis protein
MQVPNDKLRVLVADDHPSIRENLRYLLNAEADMTVVGVASNGRDVLTKVRELQPDVIVLDNEMPGGPSGFAVIGELKRLKHPARVVLFTMSSDLCELARARGADACLAKDAPYGLVLDAVRAAGVFVLADPAEVRRRHAITRMGPVTPGRRRVLVVDDDEDIRGIVATALETEGFETRSVADGAQALYESVRWRPQVIVLDVLMPVMGGRDFVTAYRHVPDASARIVALTALSRAAVIAKEMGVDAGLGKPFDVDELVKTVSDLAGESAA